MKDFDIQEITKEYSEDYFDENMINVIYYAAKLIYEISKGNFEYDTYEADNILINLKHYVNNVDI